MIIPLTQNQVTEIDDQDWYIISKYKWYAVKRNKSNTYYAETHMYIDGKRMAVGMHRLIMGMPQYKTVDHVNGNGLDNRKSNLRLADHFQQQRNKGLSVKNTSGYKGVRKSGDKWRADIRVNGKKVSLGMYNTPEDAYNAYKDAAIKHHGEFANLPKKEKE